MNDTGFCHSGVRSVLKDKARHTPCKGGFNPLLGDKTLDCSKLKQIADDILKCIRNENKLVPFRIENIVRKGEIACYKQFLLSSQYFPKLYIFSASKCTIVW